MDKKQVKKSKTEAEKPVVEINEKEEFKRIAEGVAKLIEILERLEKRLNGGF